MNNRFPSHRQKHHSGSSVTALYRHSPWARSPGDRGPWVRWPVCRTRAARLLHLLRLRRRCSRSWSWSTSPAPWPGWSAACCCWGERHGSGQGPEETLGRSAWRINLQSLYCGYGLVPRIAHIRESHQCFSFSFF